MADQDLEPIDNILNESNHGDDENSEAERGAGGTSVPPDGNNNSNNILVLFHEINTDNYRLGDIVNAAGHIEPRIEAAEEGRNVEENIADATEQALEKGSLVEPEDEVDAEVPDPEAIVDVEVGKATGDDGEPAPAKQKLTVKLPIVPKLVRHRPSTPVTPILSQSKVPSQQKSPEPEVDVEVRDDAAELAQCVRGYQEELAKFEVS